MAGSFGKGELLPLDEAVRALGIESNVVEYHGDVPLDMIVGTAGRVGDFDGEFRPLTPAVRERWRSLAQAAERGAPLPRVRLTRLGELYFVVDGHHRVSVARHRGQVTIPASVRWVCTVAYAMCCLRLAHLPSKAAEREFLARVPLPFRPKASRTWLRVACIRDVSRLEKSRPVDGFSIALLNAEVRAELWLDQPSEWLRLADSAEAWGFREALRGSAPCDRLELANRWWDGEVVPLVRRLRAARVGEGMRDIQLYAKALAVRDLRGQSAWPESGCP